MMDNKEYEFKCGNYRSFIVTAKSKKQARERFDKASKILLGPTCGFELKHVTEIILKKDKNE